VSKGIAFFDFDGTITTKDTFLEFLKFTKGKISFLLGFLLHAHYLVAFKLKIISNQKAKEKILGYYFSGEDEDSFKKSCDEFNKRILPSMIRPKAIEEISRLKAMNYIVVVVSASPEDWIRPWTKMMNVELIASRLEVKDGKITGKIVGKNCRGPEKVRRIKENYNIDEFADVYAFGDTSGDKDMLAMATNAFYKPFRN
jgi:phosphatidylglycerophosphatase C